MKAAGGAVRENIKRLGAGNALEDSKFNKREFSLSKAV